MNCVRCSNEFENPNHPMAHFSVICQECRNKSPETIYDQTTYNMNIYRKCKMETN